MGILVSLAPGLGLTLAPSWAKLRQNPTQTAMTYDHNHPGRAYFPWNPVVGLLHANRLYHLDPAIYDREAVGYFLTKEQLQHSLPARF